MPYYNNPNTSFTMPNQSHVNNQSMGPNAQNTNYNTMNQAFTPQLIPPKMIRNEMDIMAPDIPMNGGFATFVQNDFSQVILKRWEGDGIHTNVYLLQKPNKEEEAMPQGVVNNLVLERLTRLENLIQGITTNVTNNNPPTPKYEKPQGGKNNE